MRRRTLIVGLGRIGALYDRNRPETEIRTHARAFLAHPRFELVGGVDPDAGRREAFERHHGVTAFPTINAAMIAAPDLVAVACPTDEHESVVHTVLAAHRKTPPAILCEKPLASRRDGGARLLEECRSAGAPVFVNYMRRCDPAVIEVARRIGTGEIAQPIRGVGWYSKGLVHNGSHLFNLLEYWLGPMTAFGVARNGRRWAEVDPEPDVDVTFDRGRVVLLAAWEEHFSHFQVELLAANGRLRYESGGDRVVWQPVCDDEVFAGYRRLGPEEILAADTARSQWHVADHLARRLDGDETARLCSGDAALTTLDALERICATL